MDSLLFGFLGNRGIRGLGWGNEHICSFFSFFSSFFPITHKVERCRCHNIRKALKKCFSPSPSPFYHMYSKPKKRRNLPHSVFLEVFLALFFFISKQKHRILNTKRGILYITVYLPPPLLHKKNLTRLLTPPFSPLLDTT